MKISVFAIHQNETFLLLSLWEWSNLTIMKQLPENKIKQLIANAFWDKNVNTDYLYKILDSNIDKSHKHKMPEEEINFYCRVLSTYDWYTLLKIAPIDKLRLMLADEVINRLFPKELKI